MKKSILNRTLLLIVTLGLYSHLSFSKTRNTDFILISKRIVYDNIENTKNLNDSIVKVYMGLYKDGAFIDIDYLKSDISNWEPVIHLERLLSFSLVICDSSSCYYENDTLKRYINDGLAFWYVKNPSSRNWWYNQISVPQKIGLIILAFQESGEMLSSELLDKIIKRWEDIGGKPSDFSGANQADIALHQIYLSLIKRNSDTLKESLSFIFNPIKLSTEEGFQYDYSYCQHGKQLYVGGYGDVLLNVVFKVLKYVEGTTYTLTENQFRLLSTYMRETLASVIRGDVMNYNCHGRSVSRKDQLLKKNLIPYFEYMKNNDTNYKYFYEKTLSDLKSGRVSPNNVFINRHFYIADYFLHVRPNYSFSVRFSSNRTRRNEYGNDENLKGYFISDGSTDCRITGKEYYNIMALWNWAFIPGVTSPKSGYIPIDDEAWGTPGTSDFAGGVSDSIYGACVYKYYDKKINTGGSKCWFCFDNEIVCLGSNFDANEDLYTSVEQNWGDDFFCLYKKVDHSLKEFIFIGEKDFRGKVFGVYHKNIGYYFPYNEDVSISNQTRYGNWYDINKNEKDSVVSGKVFNLNVCQLNQNRIAKSYDYIILPATSKDEFYQYILNPSVEILANTDSVAAVYNSKLKILQAVFFTACNLTSKKNDVDITVDSPCVILLKDNEKDIVIHVSDPTYAQKSVMINIVSNNKLFSQRVDFKESSEYRGKTEKIVIKDFNTNTKEMRFCNNLADVKKNQDRSIVISPYNKNTRCRIIRLDGICVKDIIIDNEMKIFLSQHGYYIIETSINGETEKTQIII